jgi:hypothetical protein
MSEYDYVALARHIHATPLPKLPPFPHLDADERQRLTAEFLAQMVPAEPVASPTRQIPHP